MQVRLICGNKLYEKEGEPVCGHVWDTRVTVSDWVSEAVSATCPSCGWGVSQREGHAGVRDHEMPLAVVLCGRDAAGRVLAISRKDDHTAFGLPGGKVDPEDGPTDPEHIMETLRRAIIREVREEIGVELDPDDLWCDFQLPDPYGYWNFCFGVSGEALAAATTQPGEGVVAWVDWETLERGPFGPFNSALQAHLWNSERFLDEATPIEEVDEYIREHGGDPVEIGARGEAFMRDLLQEFRQDDE